MFPRRIHPLRHPGVEIRGGRNRQMRGRRPGDGTAAKTRSEAGATPPRRAIAARSLRASGVTPASCCSESQLVFWPREWGAATEL